MTIVTLNGSYRDGAVCRCLLPFTPSYYAYYSDLLDRFLLWEQTIALFHLFSPPPSPFILPIPPVSLFLSSIRLPPLYPALSTHPLRQWEREREGEGEKRQDKPALLKTLFTPGTKQHVISALGETLTRAGKEGDGGGRTDRDRRAGSEAELKPQQACD